MRSGVGAVPGDPKQEPDTSDEEEHPDQGAFRERVLPPLGLVCRIASVRMRLHTQTLERARPQRYEWRITARNVSPVGSAGRRPGLASARCRLMTSVVSSARSPAAAGSIRSSPRTSPVTASPPGIPHTRRTSENSIGMRPARSFLRAASARSVDTRLTHACLKGRSRISRRFRAKGKTPFPGPFLVGGTGLEPVTPSLSSQSARRSALALARIGKGIRPPRRSRQAEDQDGDQCDTRHG